MSVGSVRCQASIQPVPELHKFTFAMTMSEWKWPKLYILLIATCTSFFTVLVHRAILSADHEEVQLSKRAPPSASFGEALSVQAIGQQMVMEIRNRAGQVTNRAHLATNNSADNVAECRSNHGGEICYEWQDDGKELRISRLQNVSSDVECFDFNWSVLSCVPQAFQDCFSLDYAHWYGGFEDYNQYWPMNAMQHSLAPYVAGDTWNQQYGDVLERLFVSSNGFGIFVYPDVPLYLSFNENDDKRICLAAKYDRYPYFTNDRRPPFLHYEICQGSNILDIWKDMTKRHVQKPRDIPNESLIRNAIWSTWAIYKGDINQTKVLEFAQQIHDYNFPCSQIEIDDNWTPKYGDIDFDKRKFPDPKAMIAELTHLGYRTTVWMHPFFNMDSEAAIYAATKGYLLRALDSPLPALVSWWRGAVSTILDTTNSEAVEWYLNKTRFLHSSYNITSFKFDAGESNWLPHSYSSKVDISNPDEYSRRYIEMAYNADPDTRSQEVRVGVRSQDKPIMFRMLDRQTGWGYHRAIKTLIPCALTFGIIGYPFILPDLIGGNGYDEECIDCTIYPEAELFIRWLQVNTFLPFIQFSVGPWVYNDTVVSITRKFLDLRSNYTDRMVSLAREATQTGAPIVRPLWWIAPTDRESLTSDSQYLLGDDLLVAPVLEQGARSRDVYLPGGTWRDELHGDIYTGPQWLIGYSAGIDELPYFQRI